MIKYWVAALTLLTVACTKKDSISPDSQSDQQNELDVTIPLAEVKSLGKVTRVVESNTSFKLKLSNQTPVFTQNSAYQAYSFGDMVKLTDSSILCVANRFPALDDFGHADFVSNLSSNLGMKWEGEKFFKAKEKGMNIMAPNLLRIGKDDILLVYANKINDREITVNMRVSRDNGKTFGAEKQINSLTGYQAFNNSRLLRLSSGRILLPTSIKDSKNTDLYNVFCYYSDDSASNWKRSNILSSDVALMEPGVTELPGGDLLMVIRTKQGKLFFSRSHDKGRSWKELYSSDLVSPEAPGTIFRYRNRTVLIWNNTPYVKGEYRNRTPLSVAVSEDDGYSWSIVGAIESDTRYQYSYVSALVDKENVYLSYYKRLRTDDRSTLIFTKMNITGGRN